MNRVTISSEPRSEAPAICVVTGRRDSVERVEHSFSWVTPAIWLTAFLGVIWPFLLVFILRKRATLALGFAPGVYRSWRRRQRLSTVAVVLGIFGTVGGLGLGMASIDGLVDVPAAVSLGVGLGSFVGMVATSILLTRGRGPQLHHIDDDSVTLSLPSDEAARLLAEAWPPRREPLVAHEWKPLSEE